MDEITGIVWLLLTHNAGETTEKQITTKTAGVRTVWLSHSADDGKTWAAPVNITGSAKDPSWAWYATGPGIGIQIRHGVQKGRLVVPCDYSFGARINVASEPGAGAASHVIYSDDHGETWKIGGSVQPNMNECQVVEIADDNGTLLLNMRNYAKGDYRAQSLSFDGGTSWTKPERHPELAEPRCQASILRYNWPRATELGRILFSNPASTRRLNMTVRVSRDDGKTWPFSRTIHPGASAYSCLAMLPDKEIGCLFERGDKNAYERITFARFPISWLETKEQ